MTTRLVSTASEASIQIMHLSSETQDKVRNTISRYTMPADFCGILNYLAFRVENAFKSIFGLSDWQKTRYAAVNDTIALAGIHNLYSVNPQNQIEELINDRTNTFCSKIVDETLTTCFVLNQTELDARLEERLKGMDFNQLLADFSQKMTLVKQRAAE